MTPVIRFINILVTIPVTIAKYGTPVWKHWMGPSLGYFAIAVCYTYKMLMKWTTVVSFTVVTNNLGNLSCAGYLSFTINW
jgi:hypothetical protein